MLVPRAASSNSRQSGNRSGISPDTAGMLPSPSFASMVLLLLPLLLCLCCWVLQ